MNEFKIAETESFARKIKKSEYKKLYGKIRDYIYPQLRRNPWFGPNIKKLKGQYSDFYRYRIGDYRLFYRIDQDKILVFIIDLNHRQSAY